MSSALGFSLSKWNSTYPRHLDHPPSWLFHSGGRTEFQFPTLSICLETRFPGSASGKGFTQICSHLHIFIRGQTSGQSPSTPGPLQRGSLLWQAILSKGSPFKNRNRVPSTMLGTEHTTPGGFVAAGRLGNVFLSFNRLSLHKFCLHLGFCPLDRNTQRLCLFLCPQISPFCVCRHAHPHGWGHNGLCFWKFEPPWNSSYNHPERQNQRWLSWALAPALLYLPQGIPA